MALRNRTAIPHITNQENVKTADPLHIKVLGNVKRAALGEIGNKVNTVRGIEPVDRTSLLWKDKKKVVVPTKQTSKPVEKVLEKRPVQIVVPIVKNETQEESNVAPVAPVAPIAPVAQKKEIVSFSSDLLAVEDIDKDDDNNPLSVSIYCRDIYNYLRTLEAKYPIKKGYLANQLVTSNMRNILVNWLIDVHQQFHLLPETLYLTVAITDRFLQAFQSIDKKRLQLVGITAMFIASKYEEMYAPDISDFVYIADNTYTKEEILQMEMLIVKNLDYSFGRPLPLHFLRRYSKAGKAVVEHHTMAKYFLEQCLVHYEMCHYAPSLIAAAALYLAFLIIGNKDEDKDKEVWTNTLVHYSTYTKDDVLPVVREIAKVIVNATKSKYQAVRKKYAQGKFKKISVHPKLGSQIIICLATEDKEEAA